MLIFLTMLITVTICIYYFKLSPIVKKKIFKESNFNSYITKSDLYTIRYGSDLVSLKHQFGETIFELQKEINTLKLEIEYIKEEISKIKT